jgi:transcriptional regulator with XRE-family HTH domain
MSTRPADPPHAPHDELEPGIRAARKRLGLSQERAAELAGVPLSTFRRWDRLNKPPGNIAMAQAVAEALDTPIEVLWPPEDNPVVAAHLSTLREERARLAEEEALADPEPDETLWEPRPEAPPAPAPAAPPPATTPGIPPVDEILALVDGPPRSRRRPTVSRRVRALGALGLVATLAIVAVTVTLGSSDDPAPSTTARLASPAADRGQRPVAVVALNESERREITAAMERRDYRRAIAIAKSINDGALVAAAERDGARTVLRRASNALDDRRFADARRHLRAAVTYGNPYPARARALYGRLHGLEDRVRRRRARAAASSPGASASTGATSTASPTGGPGSSTSGSTPSAGSNASSTSGSSSTRGSSTGSGSRSSSSSRKSSPSPEPAPAPASADD